MNITLTERQFDLIVDHNQLINEAWYNTVMDVVGWVDPTGIVDTVNGISYITQGNYLFGFLSIISAVPYIGDVAAKPVLHALKIGKPSTKALEAILKLSRAGKTTEAASELAKITKSDAAIKVLTKAVNRNSDKLTNFINVLPGGVLKGFKKTLLDWVDLFKQGATRNIGVSAKVGNLSKKFANLTPTEQVKNLKELKKAISSSKGLFGGYSKGSKFFSWDTLSAGMPRLIGGNRSVRALMRRSKWYLGFLDFLGIGNFVGPEELSNKIGKDEFERMMAEYNKTDQAEKYFSDQFGDYSNLLDTKPEKQATETKPTQDPLDMIFNNLFSI